MILNMVGGVTEYGKCLETGKRQNSLLWPKPPQTEGTEWPFRCKSSWTNGESISKTQWTVSQAWDQMFYCKGALAKHRLSLTIEICNCCPACESIIPHICWKPTMWNCWILVKNVLPTIWLEQRTTMTSKSWTKSLTRKAIYGWIQHRGALIEWIGLICRRDEV